MDARQLTYFLGIVDEGSYSRAAEVLHIAQPSLSQSIKQLERELGVNLFHRVGRGVTLSESGRQLVLPARQVVRSLQVAHDAVHSTRQLLTGTVELTTMPSPGIEPLTHLITDFRHRHPSLTFSVHAAFTAEEAIEATSTGTVEIGLLGTSGQARAPGLEQLALEQQPLVLISPPGTRGSDTIGRGELTELDFVISQRGSLMRQLVDEVLGPDAAFRVVAEVAHRTSLLPLVVAGLGHSVMPESWRSLAEGLGCLVRLIKPKLHLDIAMVYRPGALSPAAQAFIDLTRERFGISVDRHCAQHDHNA